MTTAPDAQPESAGPGVDVARRWTWARFAVVLSVVTAGVVTLVVTTLGHLGLGSIGTVIAIAIPMTVFSVRGLRIPREDDASETLFLDDAFFAFAVLVLPPAGAFLAIGAAPAIGVMFLKITPPKRVFNIANSALAAAVGLGVFRAVSSGAGSLVRDALGVALATVAFATCQRVVLSTAFFLIARLPFRDTLLEAPRLQLLVVSGSLSLGLIAGFAAKAASWAPLLAMLPLVLLYVVLTEHLRAQADRARLDGLLATAMEAHASVESDEVLRALESSARTLIRCRRAWISGRGPVGEEHGVQLGSRHGTDLWLLVADRVADEPFTAADDNVLAGMAAIAGSALDNAELVDQIRHQGLHDQLTGLPNQLLFDDRARQAVQRAQRDRESVAVLAIDLDGFKKVNESFGHEPGNEVLVQAAYRLAEAVREVDTLARMSGDHFNVLIPGAGSTETVTITADRLLDLLRRPFRCGDRDVFLTASIGIAVGPTHGLTASELLRNADSALHQVKAEGGDARRVYSPDMNEQALARLSREAELHAALRNNELYLLYQPQINLRSGVMVGVEALVRWRHPILGVIPPDDFIPIAEESGLIGELDGWVLRTALAQLKLWDDDGLPPLHMAVNQSGRNFNDDRIIDQVISALERTGIDPARLEIEITERVALRGAPETIALLDRLRSLGVRLAVDDFGTGYSSLGQLQQFTVDRLKIDRAFLRQVTNAHGPAPLIAAFIGIARALDMEVVAEGVETAEQEAFLRRHDCDEAQGYLYAKPIPPDEIAALLRRNQSLLVTAS